MAPASFLPRRLLPIVLLFCSLGLLPGVEPTESLAANAALDYYRGLVALEQMTDEEIGVASQWYYDHHGGDSEEAPPVPPRPSVDAISDPLIELQRGARIQHCDFGMSRILQSEDRTADHLLHGNGVHHLVHLAGWTAFGIWSHGDQQQSMDLFMAVYGLGRHLQQQTTGFEWLTGLVQRRKSLDWLLLHLPRGRPGMVTHLDEEWQAHRHPTASLATLVDAEIRYLSQKLDRFRFQLANGILDREQYKTDMSSWGLPRSLGISEHLALRDRSLSHLKQGAAILADTHEPLTVWRQVEALGPVSTAEEAHPLDTSTAELHFGGSGLIQDALELEAAVAVREELWRILLHHDGAPDSADFSTLPGPVTHEHLGENRWLLTLAGLIPDNRLAVVVEYHRLPPAAEDVSF